MSRRIIWVIVLSLIVSFTGGFLLANMLNRSEINRLRAAGTKTSADAAADSFSLTNEELKQKIAEADARPQDFSFQKNLGMALYRYGSLKQDPAILADAARILVRANELDSTDPTLEIGIGNAYFDIGYFNKDNASLERSREFYQKALTRNAADADVRTDLALSYFLQQPPDLAKAETEFKRALESKPKHERALQYLVQTLAKEQKASEANTYLKQLQEVNPANASLKELAALIENGGQAVVQ